jgi:membrane protease YdiL (CAAX protease family)
MTPRRWTAVLFAVVLLAYLAFRLLGRPGTWQLAADDTTGLVWTEGLIKIGLWVVPCLLVLRVTLRVGYAGVFDALGLGGGAARGYLFGLIATVPMLLVLPLERPLRFDAAAIVGTALLGPVAEEVLFRGFLFRQLYRRAGWIPRRAMLASALAFGVAHLGNVPLRGSESFVPAVGEVGMTAAGGLLFAWVVFRWDSLWPAVGLHSFMNLSWEIFSDDGSRLAQTGATPIGSSLANGARLLSIGVAVYLTLRRTWGVGSTNAASIWAYRGPVPPPRPPGSGGI